MKIKPRLKEEIKKYLLTKQQEERKKATITAAYHLNEVEISKLKEIFPALKGRKIIQQIDESIIAGLIIKYESKVVDLSLRQRLSNLEHRINEIT